MLRNLWCALAVMFVTVQAIQPASAQRADDRRDGRAVSDNLGCVEVGRRADFDVIEVGKREGRYSAIRLSARGNDVRINDLRVIYGNGDPDRIRVNDELRENGETRPLDLQGSTRNIARIELVSQRDFKGRGKGRASICVSGLLIQEPRRAEARKAVWDDLGCIGVGLRPDFDVIEVGRREGRYRAVRLRVKGGDVNLDSLRVIYGNGSPDDIPVRSLLREGRESGTLDLQGRDRVINRIELRSKRDTKDVVKDLIKGKGVGRAVICVDGLQIDRNDNDRRGGDGRGGDRRDRH